MTTSAMTTITTRTVVDADPYPWPWTGHIDLAHTALVLIDWQHDFCGPGGYVDTMGYDLSLTRSPVATTRRVLDAWRRCEGPVVHTQEGHKADLSDCPAQQALALAPHRSGDRRQRPVRALARSTAVLDRPAARRLPFRYQAAVRGRA